MNKKNKDCVFALGLIAVSCYVIYESGNMLERASRSPYRIQQFSISPGMLPMVLGWALMVFAVALLVSSLRGGTNGPAAAFIGHLRLAGARFREVVGTHDMISMIVCTLIMFVFTFFVVGAVPFWAAGTLFLVTIMLYLRATRWWIILLCSCISVGLIILLFQEFFRTSLP